MMQEYFKLKNTYFQSIKMWQKRGISNKQMMVIGTIMNECLSKCDEVILEVSKQNDRSVK